MKAFITGASGFVGTHLKAHLDSCQDKAESIAAKDCDIRNFLQVKDAFSKTQPDVIYHLAGLAFVPECEQNFLNALEINVAGTENVLKAAREVCPTAKVVLISSGDSYGKVEPELLPFKESDNPKPINNYSLSKHFAEKLGIRASEVFGQSVVIMRPFNHIGPAQSPRFAISSFAQQLALMRKGLVEPILKVGNLSAKRDLTDVRDIVRGYRLAAQKGSGTYNLCSGISVTIQSVLDMLIQISGVNVKVEIDPSRLRTAEMLDIRGSYDKAKQELGWEPHISLEQSLKDCFEFFIKN